MVVRMSRVCFRCGFMLTLTTKNLYKECPVCGTTFIKLGFLDGRKLVKLTGDQRIQWIENKYGYPITPKMTERRKEFLNDENNSIKKRKEDLKNKTYESNVKTPTSRPTVTCPYCKSTNTTKITSTEKVVNAAMFGLLGNKRKMQWHCNNCTSDF